MVCSSFFNEGIFMNVLQCDLFKKKKSCSLFCTNLTRLLSSEVAKHKSIKWLDWQAIIFVYVWNCCPHGLKGTTGRLQQRWGTATVLCTLHVLLQRGCWFQSALPVGRWPRPRWFLTANQNELMDARARTHTQTSSHLRLHAVRYFTRYIKRLKNDEATNNCKISNTVTTKAHRLLKNTGASSWMKEHKCDLIQNKHTSAHSARALRPPGCVCLP